MIVLAVACVWCHFLGSKENVQQAVSSSGTVCCCSSIIVRVGVVTKTTDRDSLRYTYNGTRRVRQLALGCESN